MADSTKWTCGVDPTSKVATLTVSKNGGSPVRELIRGVCYSPAPINGTNKEGPAIGDWFWDDFDPITGWDALWQRDLPQIRALGCNAIRVYCSLSRQLADKGKFPDPWNSGSLFKHNKFLDLCWNGSSSPLYVLVGIPLPATMLWKTQYGNAPPALIDFWTNVLGETVTSMGQHPAVLGFTIQNEQDGANVCYNDPDLATFWWGQVEKFAAIVKEAAPDKLVGMATHDDLNIPLRASSYMEKCPHMDFWGINTYQTKNFDSVYSGYRDVTGSALKPVVLTEFGLPATGHRNDNATSIYEDESTRQKTAAVVGNMLPQAFENSLGLGVYYFEYCDEWWNQPEAGNNCTWYGGPSAPGFPNGYWDNDGFGLFSIKRGDGLANDAPIWVNNGPNTPIDEHTERTEITAVVRKAYQVRPASS